MSAEPASKKMVRVITKKEGEATRFFVENLEPTEITATFQVDTVNLKSNVKLPYTATFPANQISEAFMLTPAKPGEHWTYNYINYFIIGSHGATHDNSYVYTLPFAPSCAYKVSQGYNGSYSHSGSDQYAIDFKMPVGTPIHAARDGLVVKIKHDSDRGGADRKYEGDANYILIRHDDGTVGNYAHLMKSGATVKTGDRVKAGELIAFSGNTGFSSGPHLHFSVFKARSGRERQSIPVKFKTAESAAITLMEGKTYAAYSPDYPPSKTLVVSSSPRGKEKPAAGRPAR
jgi:murein DD-endopeptidase MepM/ murein hydrolase activator NlpD